MANRNYMGESFARAHLRTSKSLGVPAQLLHKKDSAISIYLVPEASTEVFNNEAGDDVSNSDTAFSISTMQDSGDIVITVKDKIIIDSNIFVVTSATLDSLKAIYKVECINKTMRRKK